MQPRQDNQRKRDSEQPDHVAITILSDDHAPVHAADILEGVICDNQASVCAELDKLPGHLSQDFMVAVASGMGAIFLEKLSEKFLKSLGCSDKQVHAIQMLGNGLRSLYEGSLIATSTSLSTYFLARKVGCTEATSHLAGGATATTVSIVASGYSLFPTIGCVLAIGAGRYAGAYACSAAHKKVTNAWSARRERLMAEQREKSVVHMV